MCQKCKDLIDSYYPSLTDDEKGELMMGATAYPLASPEYFESQLKELKENTDGTLSGALVYANEQLYKEWQSLN